MGVHAVRGRLTNRTLTTRALAPSRGPSCYIPSIVRARSAIDIATLDVYKRQVQHHEVGTAGQAEIDMRFDTLTKMGDKMMVFKYVIKNVAAQHGYVATFMPKPLFQDNGSGMHIHQSLWKDGQNLFADSKGYAGLSEMAVHYIGGLLKHAPALLAILSLIHILPIIVSSAG